MQITLYSLLMSVVWSSILAAFNHVCRKKRFFIRQLGITNILFLYLFSIARMLIPYKFSFTRVIHSKGAFTDLCESASVNQIGAAQISPLSALAAAWALVSALLTLQFAYQYLKATKEFSTYSICEDGQCRRIFQKIQNRSQKQIKIQLRYSSQINIPMGVGIFRKSIILPEETYSDSELYYILRHEYTHFLNKDLLLKIFVHLYWCIFWWNPAIYLIKRDLAQILEIKCDLDVTDNMKNEEKAAYLTTIVTMLKKAGTKKAANTFYGATALFGKNDVLKKGRMALKG